MSGFDRDRLAPLLAPRSIAVIGASAQPFRVGWRLTRHLAEYGFGGRVLPVNPRGGELFGLTCATSIEELPETPDLALVAVSADQTADTLRAVAARGIPAAIAYAAGFREADAAGERLEAEVAAVAREAGLTLLGPNSAGVRNTAASLYATFTTDINLGPLPGGVGLVSQSGGLAGYLGAVCKSRGVGHKWLIDTGNELDVEMADVIDWFAGDADVRVIGLITEGVKDGARLRAALEVARDSGTPVVALKIGTSAAGALAAWSHTGALAGTDGVYDAVFAGHGAYRARDERDFVEALALHEATEPPRGRNVAVFSLSGGVATQLVDACEERGLAVPSIEPPADPELRRLLPASRFENPLDLTGQIGAEPQLLGAVLDHVASLPQVDVVVLGFAYMMQDQRIADVFAPAVIEARRASGTPMVLVGLTTPEAQARLREAGIVVETHATDAVDAIAALVHERPAAPPAEPPPAPAADGATQTVTGPEAAGQLPGIAFAESVAVDGADAALAAARSFGGPVVVKGEAPGVAHKSELGLVRVGLRGDDEIRAAYAEVAERLAPHGGAVHVQPVLDGVETLLGIRRDPTFGPVVTVGLGGIFVEVLGDVAFGLPPVDAVRAREMIEALRGYPLLVGARGRPPAAVADLVAALVALSEIAAADLGIEELDVNPFIVGERPGSSAAVDAVIVRRRA